MFDPEKIKEIEDQVKTWNEKIEKSLSKNAERKQEFKTTSEIPVHRVFSPDAVSGIEYLSDLNLPGEFPYTRGIQPTMYRGRFWTMRQYAGFGTAEDTNRRYQYLLKHGQTGLSVAFDLPTQIGYDSDHPLAQGEVGKVGVAIDSVKDMEVLFDRIPLDKVSTSMTINAPASILLAMYIAVAEKQGVTPDKLNGTIQNDILKEYPPGEPTSSPRNPRCGSSPTSSSTAPGWRQTGTRSASAATTCGRPAARRFRRWPSPSPTGSPTWKRRRRRVWTWMFSPRGSPFSSMPTGFSGGDRQVSGRPAPLGEDHEGTVRGQESPLLDAAIPYPDRRLHLDRPAAI